MLFSGSEADLTRLGFEPKCSSMKNRIFYTRMNERPPVCDHG
jgi:hypothetical protein